MKLILLSVLQSVCAVAGMALVHQAVEGKPSTILSLVQAMLSLPGVAGIVALLSSFVLTTMILSFTRVAVFIPLNTGMVFLFTVIYAVVFHHDRLPVAAIFGMVLITAGIALVSQYR